MGERRELIVEIAITEDGSAQAMIFPDPDGYTASSLLLERDAARWRKRRAWCGAVRSMGGCQSCSTPERLKHGPFPGGQMRLHRFIEARIESNARRFHIPALLWWAERRWATRGKDREIG